MKKNNLDSPGFNFMVRVGTVAYKHFFPIYLLLYYLYKKCFCKKETMLIKKLIKSGMAVIDIGSNVGYYARIFSDLVGKDGRVYCFEPASGNFRLLKLFTKNKTNIVINKIAAGSERKNGTLYISDTSNLDHAVYETGERREGEDVEIFPLDEYDFEGRQIDFIKMDIQGFEYDAILGMKNLLTGNPGIKLLCEFWPHGLRRANRNPEEFIDTLINMGFRIFIVQGDNIEPFFFDKVNARQGSRAYWDILCSKDTFSDLCPKAI